MKPLYIVGTQRDVGKTTLSIGLLSALKARKLKVAYAKPLGQRVTTTNGRMLHDDARVVAAFKGNMDSSAGDMAVPLPSGRVEREVNDPQTRQLHEKIIASYRRLAADSDVVIVEAMGHVAMGSCLGLSSADVARDIGAKCILVAGGGIGRTIDEVALCSAFLTSRQADLIGVVINKVWPQKFARVSKAARRGLENLGLTCFGAVPFEDRLSAPTMHQVHDHIGGELLAGEELLHLRVGNTIVAAMEASHMVNHIRDGTLIITPGDRSDNILAALSTHMLESTDTHAVVSGLILTGGFRPGGTVLRLKVDSHLPTIMVEQDTYTVASKLRETVYKLTPDDLERLEWAVCLIAEHIDIEAIVSELEE